MSIIAAYGGGFKPPTAGHFEVVKRTLEKNPEIDELIIYVGAGERNGISQVESILIWDTFANHLPMKVRIEPSKAPIGDIIRLGKNNPKDTVYFVIGGREGREDDMQDIASRTKGIEDRYKNMKIKIVQTPDKGMSGTNARKAAKVSSNEFFKFLPNELDDKEKQEVFDIVRPVINEEITKSQLNAIEDYADKLFAKLGIDIEFTKHFLDRVNDERNVKPITIAELIGMFKRLYKKHGKPLSKTDDNFDAVVKDFNNNINIPFAINVTPEDIDLIAKTVMRKKDFKTSTPIIALQEGRYEQEVLIQSRYIVNQFKNSFGKNYTENLEGNIEDVYYDLDIEFIPLGIETLGALPYIISAAGDNDSIEILIQYNPRDFPEAYNDLIAEIKETLRHELEHVGQFNFDKGVNVSKINQDDLPFVEYLTLDYEIPAFIQGLYKKAKTKKIPLSQAIDGFFRDYASELSSNEEKYVRKEWAKWIKSNLSTVKETENPDDGKSAPFGSGYGKVNENASYSKNIDVKSKIMQLTQHMLDKDYNIEPLPTVEFVDGDSENARDFLGKTAYYDPNTKTIVLYTEGRHPKDITRSYAHEMIHHIQNLEGRLGDIRTTNTQEDDSLNDIEAEANLKGTMTFRNWTDSLNENLNEDLTLSPFDYDQDGNESRIKRDINNKKGWRRLGSKSAQNDAIKKYLDKYTSNYKWGSPPKSDSFPEENKKMYKTPYIMYVHLLQTSEGKNNIIDALKGVIANEPDNTLKQVLQALTLVFMDKEDQFKKVYLQYKDMIENNAKDDNGANPFSALKYADENFTDKEGIFTKFVRNGWSAGKFNLNEDEDPCWDDYKIGSPKTKISPKTSKRVNNCVPKNESKDYFGLTKMVREILIPEEEVVSSPPMKYKIFSDMDGVLTDFDDRFKKYSNGVMPSSFEKRYGKDKFWELIDNEGVAYWVGMPWMEDAKQYWDYIKDFNVELLSSPSRSETSRLGKRLWVRNNMPGVKLHLSQASNKKNYAEPNHILIDDRPSNIDQWIAAGGIGILHTSAADTIQQLKKLGL